MAGKERFGRSHGMFEGNNLGFTWRDLLVHKLYTASLTIDNKMVLI
jgi:hypothetical protein